MPVEIIDPLKINNWNDLILSFGRKDYSIFHSSEWAQILSESYNYVPKYFVYKSNNVFTAIAPFMLISDFFQGKRLVSLPFSDHCEPLISHDKDFENLIGYLISYCEKASIGSFEIRGGKEYFKNTQISYSYYEHILTIGEREDEIFKRFSETTRRNIKKAVKENVQVIINFDLNSLNEFYRLNCITRKKHGLPPQPYYFFVNIFDTLIKSGNAFIVSAIYDDQIIASSMYIHFGDKAYYKYGASDERFQNLRPNNLIMWEAIKHLNGKGFKTFHFGRTEFENEGLRRFKLGWGTDEVVISTYLYSVSKKAFIQKETNTSGFHNIIFRNLPIPVLKKISTLIYKYSG